MDTEPTYTAGPWRVSGEGYKAVVVDGNDSLIATPYGDSVAEAEANANLIGAALYTYNALAAIVDFCDYPGLSKPETLAHEIDRILPVARVALEKARGER